MAKKKQSKSEDEVLEVTEEIQSDTAPADDGNAVEPESEQLIEPEQPDEPMLVDSEVAEDEYGTSLSSKVLTGLALLLTGGVLALWGGPKVAPYLPAGLAPVADFLAPGGQGAREQVAALRVEMDDKISAMADGQNTDDVNAAIAKYDAAIQSQLTALSDQLASTDGAAIESRLAQLETTAEGLTAQMQTLTDSLTNVASDSAGLSTEAAQQLAAYQARIKGLQAEIQSLSSQQGMLSQKIDDVSVTSERKVKEATEDAATRVATAEVKRGLSELAKALDSGAPFGGALDTLRSGGLDIPQALVMSADKGVVPMAALKTSFSSAAHTALKASIKSQEPTGLGDKLGLFLKSQVTVRSLEPKEGSDPDAVLSRVQGFLNDDNLAAAIEQASTLPDAAKSSISDWLDNANTRLNAVRGLDMLQSSIDS